MSEKEKLNAMFEFSHEKGMTTDEWLVALLSSIASSLAIIADSVSREGGEQNDASPTGAERSTE